MQDFCAVYFFNERPYCLLKKDMPDIRQALQFAEDVLRERGDIFNATIFFKDAIYCNLFRNELKEVINLGRTPFALRRSEADRLRVVNGKIENLPYYLRDMI